MAMTDQPQPGKVYALTGKRSIAAGDNWQASEVWCAGFRDRTGSLVHHVRGAAKRYGCTPQRCGSPMPESSAPWEIER